MAVAVPEIVEGEVGAAREYVALFEQRRDLALVAGDQIFVGQLVHLGGLELHSIALAEAFDLAVAEHGQTGQRGEQRADAEYLSPVPNWSMAVRSSGFDMKLT